MYRHRCARRSVVIKNLIIGFIVTSEIFHIDEITI